MIDKPMTADRLAEIKKICACVPFIDNGVGVPETQQAFHDLIDEIARLTRDNTTLAAEVRAWRSYHDAVVAGTQGYDHHDEYEQARAATDASGAMERSKP